MDAVPIDDTDLSAQWHANVSRFAAYKAYHATEELRRLAVEEQGDMAILRATLHKYNRYQAAEYNTAVARARTGKQWLSFNDPDNARLFPYIEWLPSRSATPREAHRIFWNCRWPKNDPFWKENQPGTLWNCKCDWQETDEEPDPQKNKTALDKAEEMKQIAAEAHKPNPLCLPGLDLNPATSGQIFTDSAPYIKNAPRVILDDDTNKLLPSLQSLLNADQNAFRIDYYSDNGGLLLTSRNRIKEGQLNKQESEKFNKEHSMCRTLAINNFNITYFESVEGRFDITLNGSPADLKKVGSWKQIEHHASKATKSQGASLVIFEFTKHSKEFYVEIKKLIKKDVHGFFWFNTIGTPSDIHPF